MNLEHERSIWRLVNKELAMCHQDIVRAYYAAQGTTLEENILEVEEKNTKDWEPEIVYSAMWLVHDDAVAERLEENKEKLAQMGIGLIAAVENCPMVLFIADYGYDMFETKWEPLFSQVLKWVDRPTDWNL